MRVHPDGLMFHVNSPGAIPCSADLVAVELLGEAASALDLDLVRNAARAVLHYFHVELGRASVSVPEFSRALAAVLRGFGFIAHPAPSLDTLGRITTADLRQLARESGAGFELAFFPRLREELRQRLHQAPHVIRFTGLQNCVRQLTGARRWTDRCQRLNDHIVEYLRHCLSAEPSAPGCSLVVR